MSGHSGSRLRRNVSRARSAAARSPQSSAASPPASTSARSAAVICARSGAPVTFSSTTIAPSRRIRRITIRPDGSFVSRSSTVTRCSSACGSTGAARRIRSRASPPPISATASHGARASGSVGSRKPPRPEASSTSPGLPRARATRSGKASASRLPGSTVPPLPPPADRAHRSARVRASRARGERSRDSSRRRSPRSASLPPSPGSLRIAAIRPPVRASPASEATATRWASRGVNGIRISRRPCAVRLPSASSASSRVNTARASAKAPVGGGSSRASPSAVRAPQRARSRAKPVRSASRISGR